MALLTPSFVAVSVMIVASCFGIATPRWQVTHCTLVSSAAGFPSSDCSFMLTSRASASITRAFFFVSFSSEAKSFFGLSTGGSELWQYVQLTPSAALKFCMMGRICCPVMSFGKNWRFFGVGTCGPPPRPPPPWGAAPPARPPPAGACCAEIITVTSKTPMSADTTEYRCITHPPLQRQKNVRESYRNSRHSVDAFAWLPVAWVRFPRAGVPHRLKIHEYQAKSVLARFGVPVPRGEVIFNAAEAAAIAERLGGGVVVVKAQTHAGGRGKGGGVKLAKSPDEAERIAKQMIGMTLVTHQTGPEGRKVGRVLIEEGVQIERELYLSMLIDRAAGQPVIIASAAGGM